jgi:mannose-6-phosphate isomerase-like protein (cupin superfamily)
MSEVQLLDIGDAEQEIFSRWDITGHQTEDVVLDHLTFPPVFVPHMHRHPHADMVVIPVSGAVQFLGAPGFPVEVSPGQVRVTPRGNWHQISNVGTVHSQVLRLFAGVGSLDDVGYEAHPGQDKATASLGRRQGSSSCVSQ